MRVTLAPDPGQAGMEEFRQLSRAGGATPREPIELGPVDMELFGLNWARRGESS